MDFEEKKGDRSVNRLLADQNKQQPQEIKMRVTFHTWPLSVKQTFDRHMPISFD